MLSEALQQEEILAPIVEVDNSKNIFQDRKRTNILRSPEQRLITFLVVHTPGFITSNILTAIGLAGSILVFAGFVLATYIHPAFLLFGVFGLAINWYGDSLDGRIAYYRNIPRKWYGFALDIVMDWISTVFIGLGYVVYAKGEHELGAFLFVVLYGWSMIISQLRYKITDKYTIDAGLLGPTEVRVIIALVLIAEVVLLGSMRFFVAAMCVALFVIDCVDTRKLLKLGDKRDRYEQWEKRKQQRFDE